MILIWGTVNSSMWVKAGVFSDNESWVWVVTCTNLDWYYGI